MSISFVDWCDLFKWLSAKNAFGTTKRIRKNYWTCTTSDTLQTSIDFDLLIHLHSVGCNHPQFPWRCEKNPISLMNATPSLLAKRTLTLEKSLQEKTSLSMLSSLAKNKCWLERWREWHMISLSGRVPFSGSCRGETKRYLGHLLRIQRFLNFSADWGFCTAGGYLILWFQGYCGDLIK